MATMINIIVCCSDPLWNIVYPDSNAIYSCASFNLPPGAKMRIDAEFPRARYTSWTVYGGSQTNQLVDVDIEANEGSVNPFRPGVNRNANDRSYSIDILQDDVPPKSEPNTLYTSGKGPIIPPEYDPSGPTLGNVICLRIYVPDRGQYPCKFYLLLCCKLKNEYKLSKHFSFYCLF